MRHGRPEQIRSSSGYEAEYEAEAARSAGVRHAVAFAFARHALGSLLVSAGAKAGDEILLSPLTCKVVPLSLLWMGLKPVYVDIAPSTLNIDPDRLDAAIGPRTRAILFQHTYGSGAGLRDVALVAARHQRLLVEDCAQCLPVREADYAPGSVGRAAVFSCNLLKPLPAGSGGLMTTDDDDLAGRVREARDRLPVRSGWQAFMLRAQDWAQRRVVGPATYWPVLTTYQRISASYRERPIATEVADQVASLAYRPNAFQLRDGIRWMARVRAVADHRRRCCADYRQALTREGTLVEIPVVSEQAPLLYFPILTRRKHAVLDAARRRRLQVVAWPGRTPMYPIERLEALRAYGYQPGSCPTAESVAARLLGLPTELDITAAHRRRIAALVMEISAA